MTKIECACCGLKFEVAAIVGALFDTRDGTSHPLCAKCTDDARGNETTPKPTLVTTGGKQ